MRHGFAYYYPYFVERLESEKACECEPANIYVIDGTKPLRHHINSAANIRRSHKRFFVCSKHTKRFTCRINILQSHIQCGTQCAVGVKRACLSKAPPRDVDLKETPVCCCFTVGNGHRNDRGTHFCFDSFKFSRWWWPKISNALRCVHRARTSAPLGPGHGPALKVSI